MADDTTSTPTAPAAPPTSSDEGFWHSLSTSFGLDPEAVASTVKAIRAHPLESTQNILNEAGEEAANVVTHPLDTAKEVGRGLVSAVTNPDAQATAKARLAAPGVVNKVVGAEEYLTSGIPLFGGNLVKAEEQAAQGNLRGAAGTTVGTVAPLLTDTDPVQAVKSHLAETGKTFVASAKEGLQRAATATAPEGSLEAGFAKLGGKKIKEPVTAPQGGHAGGGVASEEELNRPGRFVKVSRSGQLTDQGKTPDFNLRTGEVGYQVKPDGTAMVVDGQEGPAHKAAITRYAKEVYPTPKPEFEQSLARRGQLPDQDVNLADTYGDTGQYVGGLVKSRGQSIAEAVSPTTPSAPKKEEHPTVTALKNKYGSSDDPGDMTKGGASFLHSDGTVTNLGALDHPAAISSAEGRGSAGGASVDRTEFINDTGSIRVRHRPTAKAGPGPEIVFSIPEKGVTAEQADMMKQSVGKMGRNSNLLIEMAHSGNEPSETVRSWADNNVKEFARPADVDVMLRAMGAHPDQQTPAIKITTDNTGIKWATDPNGVRVSIPKTITDDQVQTYAHEKIAAQAQMQAAVKAKTASAKFSALDLIRAIEGTKKPSSPPPSNIPTKLRQNLSPAETMKDPDTRFTAAQHEAGHAVLNELLSPGSVIDTGIDANGGTTNIRPPAGKTSATQLSRDELQNYLAGNYAGGLSEPGGTTRAHAGADAAGRSWVIGTRALASPKGGPDEMLAGNTDMAAARAKVQAAMADPKTHQMIDKLAAAINLKGKLSGDEVRNLLKPH